MKSTRNYIIAVLALLVVAGSVLAWRQYEELVVLQARLANDDQEGLLKRLAADQRRIKSLQDEIAARSSRDGNRGRDGGPGGPPGPGNWRAAVRAAMNDPKYLQLMSIQQKSQLDSRYASLFKALTQNFNLTPEQLDQFKNLLVQKQQAMMDALQAARDQGINPRSDPQAFGQAVTSAQAAVDQQIQSALGAAAYSQYQQYEQTLPQRNTVNSVQQALSYSSAPLTDDQANQLVQLLAQDNPSSSGSSTNLRSLFNNNQTAPITAQALNDAASILAPAQVQALQQVQAAQQARQQMQQLLRATVSSNAPAAASTPR